MTFEAEQSNRAREIRALALVEPMAWGEYTFAVGGGGFSGGAWTTVLDIDLEAATLIDSVMSPAPVSKLETPNPRCIAFRCEVPVGEASFVLGEIAVWATITYAPLQPGLVGQSFMVCSAHFAGISKAPEMGCAFYLTVQS